MPRNKITDFVKIGNKPVTEKQLQVYAFIKTFVAEKRYPPTLREIAAYFKISLGSVQTYVDYLRVKGYLGIEKGKPRTLVCLK
jgi:repressor LexA